MFQPLIKNRFFSNVLIGIISFGSIATFSAQAYSSPLAVNESASNLIWQQLRQTKTHAEITIKINKKLPELHLSIFGKFINDHFKPSSLEYHFGDSVQVDRITLKEKMPDVMIAEDRSILEFIDMNFDGSLDLRVFDTSGHGMNRSQTFLYNSSESQFTYNKVLSDLPTLTVDYKNKRLYARTGTGKCEQAAYRYVIKKDTLFLERSARTQQGFVLKSGRFVSSGKEYGELLEASENKVPDCVTILEVPRTKNGLIAVSKISSLQTPSRKFRKIAARNNVDVLELLLRDKPNNAVKKSLMGQLKD